MKKILSLLMVLVCVGSSYGQPPPYAKMDYTTVKSVYGNNIYAAEKAITKANADYYRLECDIAALATAYAAIEGTLTMEQKSAFGAQKDVFDVALTDAATALASATYYYDYAVMCDGEATTWKNDPGMMLTLLQRWQGAYKNIIAADINAERAKKYADQASDTATLVGAKINLGAAIATPPCWIDEDDIGDYDMEGLADYFYGVQSTIVSGVDVAWTEDVVSTMATAIYDLNTRFSLVSMSCEDYAAYLELVDEAYNYSDRVSDATGEITVAIGDLGASDSTYSYYYDLESYEASLSAALDMVAYAVVLDSNNAHGYASYSTLQDILVAMDALLALYE